jgi:hypothetical protein
MRVKRQACEGKTRACIRDEERAISASQVTQPRIVEVGAAVNSCSGPNQKGQTIRQVKDKQELISAMK